MCEYDINECPYSAKQCLARDDSYLHTVNRSSVSDRQAEKEERDEAGSVHVE
jgi:hypothetical protein